ncbi:MAG: 2'-deoxycytidine 5'-triphosphate deaminase [Nanoarchaeota archaeon]|mgnify:CR=1 FL=1
MVSIDMDRYSKEFTRSAYIETFHPNFHELGQDSHRKSFAAPNLRLSTIVGETVEYGSSRFLIQEPSGTGLLGDLDLTIDEPFHNLDQVNREMPDINGLSPDLERAPSKSLLSISPFKPELVQNIGVDVRLSDDVWISDRLFRIYNESHLSRLEGARKERIKGRFICEPDQTGGKIYYFLTHERINHTNRLEYKVDSKSTTGRVGCMSHQISNGSLFDGRILIALQPFAFPIEIIPGETSVSQVIFRYKGTPCMSNEQIREVWGKEVGFYREDKLVDLSEVLRSNGVEMTFSTERSYVARKNTEPIDLTKRDYYDPDDFFEELEGNGEIVLNPHAFYLFGTREKVVLESICGELSRESSTAGTGLWSHFAGFFMPGYIGEITLECRNNTGNTRLISEGDPAGVVTLDRVVTDKKIEFDGVYQNQKAPRLPKVFKI